MKDIKHRKSLTMSHKLFTDLNSLCDLIGVNSHSYILNIVAREVNRDLSAYRLRARASSLLEEELQLSDEYPTDDIDHDISTFKR
jgi:hypothetical protein